MTEHISQAVDYYKVIINEDTGIVDRFIAVRTDETPQEVIDYINNNARTILAEQAVAFDLFESMTQAPAQINGGMKEVPNLFCD